jgi:thiol:disulfide interchange protein DsbC
MSKTILLKLSLTLLIGAGALLSITGFTAAPEAKDQTAAVNTEISATSVDNLKEKLTMLIGVEVDSVKPSPVAGIVEVVTNQGLFYTSADGRYLFHGQLFSLGSDVANLTEQSLAQVRVDGMAKFEPDMIVFPAKNEKYKITVFTDNTCAYCKKLHSHMDEFNAKGITVRYLAYPRQGIKDRAGNLTQNYKDMRSIWCADDPQKTMTDSKLGKNIPYRICDKPVEAEFNFGRQVGVNGTPAIMLDNGFMLPGYRQPDELLAILKSMNK